MTYNPNLMHAISGRCYEYLTNGTRQTHSHHNAMKELTQCTSYTCLTMQFRMILINLNFQIFNNI